MSLEQALNDHAAVLREFIAKFSGMPIYAAPAQERKAKAATPPAAPAPAPTPAAIAEAPKQIPYEEVSKAIRVLAAKNRDAAVEVLAGFEHKDKPGEKCTNGKELKVEDYARVLEACAKAAA